MMFCPKNCHTQNVFAFVQGKIESLLYNSLLPDGLAGWLGRWAELVLFACFLQVQVKFLHFRTTQPISSDNLSKSDIEFRERANPPNVESLLMLPTPRRHLLANSGGNEPN